MQTLSSLQTYYVILELLEIASCMVPNSVGNTTTSLYSVFTQSVQKMMSFPLECCNLK